MSRFCIFVCFLALVVSVHSRLYVRFSYEELKDDEEKASVSMMELMKPSNVLRFQQALRQGPFSWDNCGKPSKAMSISSWVVSPDPIQVGAKTEVTVQGTMDETVSSPLEAKLKVKRNNTTIPCDIIGTCDYPDICSKLPPGTCPIKKGKFTSTKSFTLSKIVPIGDYDITVDFSSKGTWLACFHIHVTIV